MNKGLIALLFCIAVSCTNKEVEEIHLDSKSDADWKISVNELMSAQEDSWNTGDLDGFMEPYLHSDSLLFVGSRGLTLGWNQTLANYKRSYPTSEKMGKLLFSNNEYKLLGVNHALVIGRWQLLRTADTLAGSYSLIWQKINGEWKIIADHSS